MESAATTTPLPLEDGGLAAASFLIYFALTTWLEWRFRPQIQVLLFGSGSSPLDTFVGPGRAVMFLGLYLARMADDRMVRTKLSPIEERVKRGDYTLARATVLGLSVWNFIYVVTMTVVTMVATGLWARRQTKGWLNFGLVQWNVSVRRVLTAGRVAIRVILFVGYMNLMTLASSRTKYRDLIRIEQDAEDMLYHLIMHVTLQFFMPLLSSAVMMFLGMSLSEIVKTNLDRVIVWSFMCGDKLLAEPFTFRVLTLRIPWFAILLCGLRFSSIWILFFLQRMHLRRRRTEGGSTTSAGHTSSTEPTLSATIGTTTQAMMSRLLGSIVGGSDSRRLTWETLSMFLGAVIALWLPTGLSLLVKGSHALAPLLGGHEWTMRHPLVNPMLWTAGIGLPLLNVVILRRRPPPTVGGCTMAQSPSAMRSAGRWRQAGKLLLGGGVMNVGMLTFHVSSDRDSLTFVERGVLLSPGLALAVCGALGTFSRTGVLRRRWWTKSGVWSLTAIHSLRFLCSSLLVDNPFVADRFCLLHSAVSYLTAHFILLFAISAAHINLSSRLMEVAPQILCSAVMLLVVLNGHLGRAAVSAAFLSHAVILQVFVLGRLVTGKLEQGADEESSQLVEHWAIDKHL